MSEDEMGGEVDIGLGGLLDGWKKVGCVHIG